MTAPASVGAGPTGAGLLGAAGAAATASAGAASGAGGDFLSLVLQMLGATSDPAPAPAAPTGGEPATGPTPGQVADAPPRTAGPGRGEPATGRGAGHVADAPPAGDPGVQAATAPDPALAALMAGVVPAPVAPVTTAPTLGTAKGAAAQAVTDTTATSPTGAGTPGAKKAGADEPAAAATADAGLAPTPAATASPATSPPASAPAAAAPASPVNQAAPATAPAPVSHQVFDRVVEAIRVSDAGPGPTRVTVKLQPESLGEVRVVMSVRDGALQVSLAGGTQAHHSLLEGAPELSRLLQAAGSPEVRVVVRDLAQGTAGPVLQSAQQAQPATQVAPVHHGQGLSSDLGGGAGASGQGGNAGQPGAAQGNGQGDGRAPGRRTPAQPGFIDVPDATTPSRRTETVTSTRTAGVDVTM